MSLLSFFRTRPTETKTPAAEAPSAAPELDGRKVVMRFLTQGGSTVELREHTWNEHFPATPATNAHTITRNGHAWRCLGCDTIGRSGTYRIGPEGYKDVAEARAHANEHATACRALPKPAA